MSGIATAVVGSAIIGGVVASKAAGKQTGAAESAAETSAGASQYAADLQQKQYEQTREDLQPWREAGVNALGQLTTGTQAGGALIRPFAMEDYQQDPGYQFRLDEAQRALEGSASARGMVLSGAQQKGVQRYGQGLASQEYGRAFDRYGIGQANEFNRLASMAGVGQTATTQLGQAGSEYATRAGGLATSSAADIANAQLAAGQAQASAYQGWGGALSSGVTGLAQYYGSQQQPASNYGMQPASSYNAFGTPTWGQM